MEGKEVKVKLNYLRISPRKVRLVADLIRKKDVERAQVLLDFCLKKPARALKKLLKSGIKAAENNYHLAPENLYIAEIRVDEGPKLKRWRPRAQGRAFMIQKKTSHVTLVLKEKEEKEKTQEKK